MRRISLLVITGCMLCFWMVGCGPIKEEIKPAPVIYKSGVDAEKIWPDKKLKDAFSRYWAYRFSEGDKDKLLSMEAPYIQEMVDTGRYNTYIKGAWRSEMIEIQIRNVVPESDSMFAVDFELWVKAPSGETRNVFMRDWWVNTHDKWYHVIKDMIFFPEL